MKWGSFVNFFIRLNFEDMKNEIVALLPSSQIMSHPTLRSAFFSYNELFFSYEIFHSEDHHLKVDQTYRRAENEEKTQNSLDFRAKLHVVDI